MIYLHPITASKPRLLQQIMERTGLVVAMHFKHDQSTLCTLEPKHGAPMATENQPEAELQQLSNALVRAKARRYYIPGGAICNPYPASTEERAVWYQEVAAMEVEAIRDSCRTQATMQDDA